MLMKFRSLIKIAIPILFLLSIQAVKAEPISYERGGIADSAGIVLPKSLQLEMGLLNYNRDFRTRNDFEYNLASTLLRYGLVKDRFELRLSTIGLQINDSNVGFQNIAPGFKLGLLHEKKYFPSINVISDFSIPFDGLNSGDADINNPELNKQGFSHSYKMILNKNLTERISFLANIGLAFNGNRNNSSEFTSTSMPYVFDLSYMLNEKISLLAEVFGAWSFSGDFGNPLGLAYGVTYAVSNDLILDFTNFYGINEAADDFGLSLGLTYRFF